MYFLMTTLKLIILLCCSSTVAISYGQTSKVDTTLRLEEVVVTGSGTERPISQSPGSIHVVTPLLLRNSPAQSVDDILSMLSGVNTTRSDGISNMHTNVSIRGLAGDEQGRTLVLFDGIPINTSDEGSVNWNSIHIDSVSKYSKVRDLPYTAIALWAESSISSAKDRFRPSRSTPRVPTGA